MDFEIDPTVLKRVAKAITMVCNEARISGKKADADVMLRVYPDKWRVVCPNPSHTMMIAIELPRKYFTSYPKIEFPDPPTLPGVKDVPLIAGERVRALASLANGDGEHIKEGKDYEIEVVVNGQIRLKYDSVMYDPNQFVRAPPKKREFEPICLDMHQVYKDVVDMPKGSPVLLRFNDDNFEVIRGHDYFQHALVFSELSETREPPLTLPVKFEIMSAHLRYIIRQCRFKDHLTVETVKDAAVVRFTNVDKHPKRNSDGLMPVGYKHEIPLNGVEDQKSMFSLDMFKGAVATLFEGPVVIKFGTDYPIQFDQDECGLKMTLMLAPRIEGD